MKRPCSLTFRRDAAGGASRGAGLGPCLLVGLLALGGCAGGQGGGWNLGIRNAAPAAAPMPVAINDPVAAFAAQAQPGSQGQIVLAGGQSATVRMQRSYRAASGRECREVLVGSGMAERVQLVCAGEDGAWAQSRPLLRGGAARP